MCLGSAATLTDAVLLTETALAIGCDARLATSACWALWGSWRGSGGECTSSYCREGSSMFKCLWWQRDHWQQ